MHFYRIFNIKKVFPFQFLFLYPILYIHFCWSFYFILEFVFDIYWLSKILLISGKKQILPVCRESNLVSPKFFHYIRSYMKKEEILYTLEKYKVNLIPSNALNSYNLKFNICEEVSF